MAPSSATVLYLSGTKWIFKANILSYLILVKEIRLSVFLAKYMLVNVCWCNWASFEAVQSLVLNDKVDL